MPSFAIATLSALMGKARSPATLVGSASASRKLDGASPDDSLSGGGVGSERLRTSVKAAATASASAKASSDSRGWRFGTTNMPFPHKWARTLD